MAGATAAERQVKKGEGQVPDYTEDSPGYLLWHGWKPLGPVKSPRTNWIDPTKPWPDGTYHKEQVRSMDQSGEISDQMHRDQGIGKMVKTKQTVFSPPAVPMILEAAVQTQVERDMRAELTRLREAK